MSASSVNIPVAPSDHRHAVAASFLGWTLDAFDYFLVVFALGDIAKDFRVTRADMAFAVSMTLYMRPIGAFVFGLIADRYGRRLPLIIDLIFFSVVEVLSGLAPNYWTFLILRALFGIGMGGEWGVGASLAMEKAPKGSRGLLSGLLQEGYATGYLLAAVCYLFVFPHFGWRPMFFIGGLPALLAVYVRTSVRESEVWERTKSESWSTLGRALASHWKLFLYIFAMMTTMNFVSHGTQDFYPTFLKDYRGFTPQQASYIAMVYNVGAILGGLAMGYYSDRVGRRRAMVTSLVLAMAAIPLWAYAPTTSLLVLGAFALQFMVQGAWGVVPAHITELAPDNVRGFMPGFAYQCGVAAAASIVYLQAVLADHFSFAGTMALTALIVFVLAAIVVAAGREHRGLEFGVVVPEGKA
jgi:SHS family lactate transporter-like MFS transporter